jgi:acyl carrier protein
MDAPTQLASIFRAVFSLAGDADVSILNQANLDAWDSMAHISLITAIESEFGVEIDPNDALELTSFHSMAVYVQTRVP